MLGRRKINGKTFHYHGYFKYKRTAQEKANFYRGFGMNARVRKSPKNTPGKYEVWYCKDRRK